MKIKVLIVFVALFLLSALATAAVTYGRFFARFVAMDAQVKSIEQSKKAVKNGIDVCIEATRMRVRDRVRNISEIRLAASTWHGDSQVIVVNGFARTVNDDVPVNAEFSRCASGYTLAVITIGNITSVGDQIEYERVQQIMSETSESRTADSKP